LAGEYRADNEGVDVTLRAARKPVPSGPSRVHLLMGTVAFVQLIACANLANLMLARAATRRPEMAIRSALGASRGRIIRQALTESGMLAAAGTALGLLAGAWGRDLLVALVPVELPAWLRFEIDGRGARAGAGRDDDAARGSRAGDPIVEAGDPAMLAPGRAHRGRGGPPARHLSWPRSRWRPSSSSAAG
jgi:hypothetical protein